MVHKTAKCLDDLRYGQILKFTPGVQLKKVLTRTCIYTHTYILNIFSPTECVTFTVCVIVHGMRKN